MAIGAEGAEILGGTAFVRRGVNPYLRTMTTGTTGWPTSVYVSAYELRVIVALSAIAFLIHGDIVEEDIVQINASSRATLGNIGLAGACSRIGSVTYLAGVVDPAHTLALLAERHRLPGKKERASAVSLYPAQPTTPSRARSSRCTRLLPSTS